VLLIGLKILKNFPVIFRDLRRGFEESAEFCVRTDFGNENRGKNCRQPLPMLRQSQVRSN